LLTLHRGGESFEDLGGLEAHKAFTRKALAGGHHGMGVRARGVLLLGVPGTGRSAFARALGNETGRPTLVLDVGSLMGSLVGQTEERTRQSLGIVDAMAPCILFIDEIEKALGGVQSSGQTDSGVSARMFGTMLSWLSDHESDVFVVATSNDISKLPPEFSRAERWDGIYFIDLPEQREKDAIWQMYINKFGVNGNQPRPSDRDWTPAEIRSACRLSALLDVSLVEAAMNVVPVAVTAGESVERLRNWASGRCLAAARPGIYSRNAGGSSSSGRSISRDPSLN
jgi:SpoVK/Ycf46/Vps4 family AAA+-type ATPase